MWNEIPYPFINFNGSSVDVSEWISNFISHFSGHVITLWVESTGDRWFLPSKAQYCGAFMLSISPNVTIKRWRGLRKQKNHFYFFSTELLPEKAEHYMAGPTFERLPLITFTQHMETFFRTSNRICTTGRAVRLVSEVSVQLSASRIRAVWL